MWRGRAGRAMGAATASTVSTPMTSIIVKASRPGCGRHPRAELRGLTIARLLRSYALQSGDCAGRIHEHRAGAIRTREGGERSLYEIVLRSKATLLGIGGPVVCEANSFISPSGVPLHERTKGIGHAARRGPPR